MACDGRLPACRDAVPPWRRQPRRMPRRCRRPSPERHGIHRHRRARRCAHRHGARRRAQGAGARHRGVAELLGIAARPAAGSGRRPARVPLACPCKGRILPAARDRGASREASSAALRPAFRRRMVGPHLSRRPPSRNRRDSRAAHRRRLSDTALVTHMNDSIVLDPATRKGLAEAWGLSPRARFAPLGNGLINRTLLVSDDGRRRVLQCLNVHVFRDPALVMRNCHAVTAHLGRERAAGRYDYSVLELVPTLAGEPAAVLNDGTWWRMYDHVPDMRTHETADAPALTFEAGRGFGAFAAALAGLERDAVGEVIPHFHDPVKRFDAFRAAHAADGVGRVAQASRECDAAQAFPGVLAPWQSLLDAGLPRRITHNDCKLNNLLFDSGGHAICVVDLDTVMP